MSLMQKLRLSLLAICVAYPILTFILWMITIFLPNSTPPQRSLIMVPCMVLSMIFIIMPFVQKHFGAWIKGK